MVIEYDGGYLQMNAICQIQGSVLPKSCIVAIPSTIIAIVLAACVEYTAFQMPVLSNSAAYSSFTFVVGFLLVFRTQTAYSRFWEGATFMQQLRGQWVGAFGSLVAFSAQGSHATEEQVQQFRQKLLRMFSGLHACALDHIFGEEDGTTEILGIDDLDDDTLDIMNLADDEALIYVIVQWIQQMILHNINDGLITTAPPIVSRVFQDLSQGVVTVNNAKKISETPFPFPYCQTLQWVLVVHAAFTPLVFVGWCVDPILSGVLTFIAVTLLWSLNFISAEIEHPFGSDPNDISREKLQSQFNKVLITMCSPGASKRPMLRRLLEPEQLQKTPQLLGDAMSYSDAWRKNNPGQRLIFKGSNDVESLYHIGSEAREMLRSMTADAINEGLGGPEIPCRNADIEVAAAPVASTPQEALHEAVPAQSAPPGSEEGRGQDVGRVDGAAQAATGRNSSGISALAVPGISEGKSGRAEDIHIPLSLSVQESTHPVLCGDGGPGNHNLHRACCSVAEGGLLGDRELAFAPPDVGDSHASGDQSAVPRQDWSGAAECYHEEGSGDVLAV